MIKYSKFRRSDPWKDCCNKRTFCHCDPEREKRVEGAAIYLSLRLLRRWLLAMT